MLSFQQSARATLLIKKKLEMLQNYQTSISLFTQTEFFYKTNKKLAIILRTEITLTKCVVSEPFV